MLAITRIISIFIVLALVLSVIPFISPDPVDASASNWEWQNPLPLGNQLNAVWGSSGTDVFAAGQSGTILHYNGTAWSVMDSGTSNNLSGIWGSSGTDVFAVGGGTILHYNGTAWSIMSMGTNYGLQSVWGSSGSDVFAVGSVDGICFILHYNGTAWSVMASGAPYSLWAVWGSSGSDVFAVGDTGTILHYNGTAWSTMDSGTSNCLKAVWGSSGNDVFAVGYKDTLLHYDGTAWNAMTSGTSYSFVGVYGSSSTDVFAVGCSGGSCQIYSYSEGSWNAGATWSTSFPKSMSGGWWIWGMWGSTGSDVFAVGRDGTIIHYNGTEWSFMLPATNVNKEWLTKIWGSSSSDVFAVGDTTILHYNGTAWNDMAPGIMPARCWLQGIWGSSGSDVFAVGEYGNIFHYDGAEWSAMTSGVSTTLNGVWGSSGSDVFAVGNSGTILHYNGTAWSSMSGGVSNYLSAVWGNSGSDVFAVGDTGTILHYNGTAWSSMSGGTSNSLSALWGSSGSDVFAAGSSSIILHYNGTAWSTVASGSAGSGSIHDIWGSSGSDVFAISDSYGNDTILHYNGSQWGPMSNCTSTYLSAIWGSSGSDVFAVGQMGTILHYDGGSLTARAPCVIALENLSGSSGNGTTAADLAGYLHSDGGSPTSITYYWGTTDGGTTAGNWDHSVPFGPTALGYFNSYIHNLTVGTTYYCRCYAINSTSSAWSMPKRFVCYPSGWILGDNTYLNAGTVAGGNAAWTSWPATSDADVTQLKVRCNGSGNIKMALYADNGSGSPGALLLAVNTPTAVISGWNSFTIASTHLVSGTRYWLGIISDVDCVAYQAGGSIPRKCLPASFSSFSFTSTPSGLVDGVGYYESIAAYAYDPQPAAPVVTIAGGATNIADTSATLNGNLTSDGLANTSVTVYWGVADGGTTTGNWDNNVILWQTAQGPFSTNISSLTKGSTYYYRCNAGNHEGSNWSSPSSFTLAASAAPTLTSPAADATVSGTSVTFTWNASAGATNYWLMVQKISDGTYIKNAAVGNVTTFTVPGFPNNGTQYRWAVAAGNGIGWGTASDSQAFNNAVAKPVAPVLTLPAAGATVSGTSVTFTWNASTGATGYWLTVRKASDNSIMINKYVGNVLTYTQVGFPNNGTQYTWTAAAGNSTGWGTGASTLTFTSGTPKPAAPVLVSPADSATVSGTSVTFTWDASTGATNYWLTVQKISDGTYIKNAAVGNVTTFTVPGFPNNGTQYRWQMAAGNSTGWGAASASQAFTNAGTKPAAPTLTSPAEGTTVSGTSVTFTWNASTGATGYWLTVRKASDNSIMINKYVGNVLTYTQAGFPNNGTQYNWTAAAGNSAGWSSGAVPLTFTNGNTVPAVPILISPSAGAAVSGTSITFTWNASAGATGYWLTVRKASDNSIMINKYVGNVLTYTQTGFPNSGTQYTWTAAAGNSSGWSSGASTLTFTNGITVPVAPTLTSPAAGATVSGTSVTFTWNASTGATGYWLTVRKVSDNSIMINKYVGNVLSSAQAGFPNDGTQYTWTAAAGNSAGWGSASAYRTFTNGPP